MHKKYVLTLSTNIKTELVTLKWLNDVYYSTAWGTAEHLPKSENVEKTVFDTHTYTHLSLCAHRFIQCFAIQNAKTLPSIINTCINNIIQNVQCFKIIILVNVTLFLAALTKSQFVHPLTLAFSYYILNHFKMPTTSQVRSKPK